MTIGIVAKSNDNECIVTVTDRRLSFDDRIPSVDGAVNKNWFIGSHWGALCASNETAFLLPVIERANELLRDRGERETGESVRIAMCDAYGDVRREYVTREYLNKYGIKDLQQFRTEISEMKPDAGKELYWSIANQIDKDSFCDTTFLVYGYEDSSDGIRRAIPRIFEVKNPGTSYLLDHAQYHAIGSGAAIALATLNLRPLAHLKPAQLIYRVLEAKFAAESSSAVGRSTLVVIANRGEPTTFLSFATIEKIRKLWEEERMAFPPAEIDNLIVETPPIRVGT